MEFQPSYPPVTTTCSDNRTALRPLIALGKLYATLSKACTMRVMLMQCIEMLIEEVIIGSPGQTFMQLVNIRHCATYACKMSLTVIGPGSDKIVLMT